MKFIFLMSAGSNADHACFHPPVFAFARRVIDGFVQLASEDSRRWVIIDGVGSVEEVAERVNAVVEAR